MPKNAHVFQANETTGAMLSVTVWPPACTFAPCHCDDKHVFTCSSGVEVHAVHNQAAWPLVCTSVFLFEFIRLFVCFSTFLVERTFMSRLFGCAVSPDFDRFAPFSTVFRRFSMRSTGILEFPAFTKRKQKRWCVHKSACCVAVLSSMHR